jgi:hypothetical protein
VSVPATDRNLPPPRGRAYLRQVMVKMWNPAWDRASAVVAMSSALLLAAIAIALIALPVACSWADGIVPGSFSYKLHATVPLKTEEEFYPPFQRPPDVKGLYNSPVTRQAGEHADMSVLVGLKVSSSDAVLDGSEIPEETVTQLPPGSIVDIGDVQPCTHAQFLNSISESAGGCPATSQVGVASVIFGGALTDRTYPLYKLVAAQGHLATLGYPYELLSQSTGVRVNIDLRADDDYGLTLTSSQISLAKFVPAPFLTIWGTPVAPAHDSERWNPQTRTWGDSLSQPQPPLVANATACDAGTREARERLRYWSAPERWLPEDPEDLAFRSFVPPPEGCDRLSFTPQGEVLPTEGQAGAPTGLDLRLRLPRAPSPDLLESPPLQGAALTLPAGMSVNPAVADGLAGCAPTQIGLESGVVVGSASARFSAAEANCPVASQVGEAVVDTPLAEDPLTGKIYVAIPYRNPFHSLLALYLVFPGPGFTAKFAVEVKAEPGDRLEASLASLPPLPVDSLRLSLSGGPRAPLAPPPGCGEGAIELSLTPSSAPESGPPARIVSRYSYTAADGDRCDDASQPPAELSAGSTVATAGRLSSFVLRLRGSELSAFTVKLPTGLSARVRGVGRCGGDEIERAEAREEPGGGLAERREPSCPASSRVGSLLVGAGPGPAPLAVVGEVYLAGRYEGAPFSLVTITPALAGGTAGDPLFDLGTIVNRVALDIDRRSGALNARVEAPPRVIDGIPLRIGDIRLVLDRPGFVRNPSRCTKTEITAVVEGPTGAATSSAAGFRVDGCNHLDFRPKLRVDPVRGRAPGAHPAMRAVLRAQPGEAGIVAARITLPASERLDRGHLRGGCKVAPLEPDGCPRAAIRGHVTAWSGLLDRRLSGPVYLRSPAGAQSELVLALDGEPHVEIPALMRLRRGRVQLEFSRLPDLQLTKLVVGLWGGRRGMLVNRRDLCEPPGEMIARFISGGGGVRTSRARFGGPCLPARGHSKPNRQSAKRTEG